MRNFLLFLSIFAAVFGMTAIAQAVQITVPSAPSANYTLLSSGAGRYASVPLSALGIFGWPFPGNATTTALTFPLYNSGGDFYSAKAFGAIGNGVADDTAALQTTLYGAAKAGKTFYCPAGTYLISSTLEASSSMMLDVNCKIQANASMTSVLNFGSNTSPLNPFIIGGIFDAHALATNGIFIRQAQKMKIENTKVQDAITYGYRIGDSSKSTAVYSTYVNNFDYVKNIAGTVTDTGSACLYVDTTATDNQFFNGTLVDCDYGVQVESGTNFFEKIHVWTSPAFGWMTIGFKDNQGNNGYTGIEADTVRDYGFFASSTKTTIADSFFVNNTTSGQNGVAVGIYAKNSAPSLVVTNTRFIGGDSTHQLANDIVASSSDTVTVTGIIDQNVATRAFYSKIDQSFTATTTVANFGMLNVGDRQPSIFGNSQVLGVRRTLKATSGKLGNIISQMTAFAPIDSSADYYSFYSEAGDNNTLGINYTGSFIGLSGTIRHRDSGTFANGYTVKAESPTWGSNTAGVNTNQYGVFIERQKFASTTNAWALYQASSTDNSYFAGNVGFGTTTPTHPLEVAGDTFLGGNLTATGTLILTPLATPAGSFLAVDPTGKVIATTTPTSGGGSGLATSSLAATWPLVLTTTSANATYAWDGIATSAAPTIGNLAYWTGAKTLGNVATSTLSASSPLTGSFTYIGSGGSLGIQAANASQNGYLSSTDYSLLHTATTTFSSPLSYSASTNAVTCPTCLTSQVWPFTTTDTNFGVAVQSTSTPEWFTAGLYASSTSQLVNANIWGNLTLKATSSALLATDASGNVIATTSIGTNYLTGILPIAKGGTATSTFYAGGVLYYDSTLGTVSQPGNGKGLFYDGVNNRVGIGSSTPSKLFTITGTNSVLFDGTLFEVTGTTGSVSNGGIRLQPGTGSTNYSFLGFDTSAPVSQAQLVWASGSTRALRIGNNTATAAPGNLAYITFGGFTTANATTTHMVGINATSTPGGLLSIAGLQGGTQALLLMSTSSSSYATSTVFRIDSNGNTSVTSGATFGVGTTTPGGLFGTQGASFNTNNGVCFAAKATGSAGAYVYWYFTSAATQVTTTSTCSGTATTTIFYD